ncbi:hypothetical protein QAD02_011605 [Eretmocerus hayati]|uniref:Uncharacterized protein n=1 Tax=Eretmocerus hayati TaxID=131215 RepID=A0ACC2NX12_9HYME|nr:hypothetical protein QAD02_011605 [Eretmocerus hayati]
MTLNKEKKMIKDGFDNLRRVKDFEKMLNSSPGMMTQFVIDYSGKSIEGANEFRSQGNSIFTKPGHDVCTHYRILKKYNESLAMSPANTEAFAYAHGNRSAILEHIGRYKESITSIDKALEVTRLPSLRIKLLCRKAKCEAVLGLSNGSKYLKQAKSYLNKFKGEKKIKETLTNSIGKTEAFLKDQIHNPPKLHDQDEELIELMSKAESDNSTSHDINYASLSGLCESIGSPLSNELGFRIFLIALKQAGSIQNLRAALESFDKCNGDDRINDLPFDDYRRVYALSSNVLKADLDEIIKDTALQMVVLAKYTSIFRNIFDPRNCSLKRLMNNDDIVFAGALILKFCAIADEHSFENSRFSDCNKVKPCSKSVGDGLISCSIGLKTSLTCRSCVPNARRCLIGNNQIILYSILPIKKGAKIFDSRLSIIDETTPRLERQMMYRDRYGFSCECQACEDNWPVINLKCGLVKYYSEVVSSLSEKDRKVFNDFFWVIRASKDPSDIMSSFLKLPEIVEYSLKEFPLPSKLSAYMIKGLYYFVEGTFGLTKPQITDECNT